ncbi:MAG: hypothetical protein K0Q50_1153 [Vampirovibrio sp.]|nr:hypothetical protein [Vampirovibrio sp.]
MQHVGVFISVKDAAAKLGVTSITITRWCESGKLPAIATSYGKKITYKISPHAVEMLLLAEGEKKTDTPQKRKIENKNHFEFISAWKTAMAKGFINGRAFSQATIDDYSFYIDDFFKRQKTVSIDSLKEELARIPASQVAKRQHSFKAVVCFAKVLITEGVLCEDFLKRKIFRRVGRAFHQC